MGNRELMIEKVGKVQELKMKNIFEVKRRRISGLIWIR